MLNIAGSLVHAAAGALRWRSSAPPNGQANSEASLSPPAPKVLVIQSINAMRRGVLNVENASQLIDVNAEHAFDDSTWQVIEKSTAALKIAFDIDK